MGAIQRYQAFMVKRTALAALEGASHLVRGCGVPEETEELALVSDDTLAVSRVNAHGRVTLRIVGPMVSDHAGSFRSEQTKMVEKVERSMCLWCRHSSSIDKNILRESTYCWGPPNTSAEKVDCSTIMSSANGECEHYSPSLFTRFLRLRFISRLGIRRRSFLKGVEMEMDA